MKLKTTSKEQAFKVAESLFGDELRTSEYLTSRFGRKAYTKLSTIQVGPNTRDYVIEYDGRIEVHSSSGDTLIITIEEE